MNILLLIAISLGIGIGLVTIVLIFVEFFTHRHMTIKESKCYGYGSFKLFLECYNSFEWERGNDFESSHFCYDKDTLVAKGYIHAGIVRFNGHGMILRFPFSFLRYQFWMWKNRVKTPKVPWKSLSSESKKGG